MHCAHFRLCFDGRFHVYLLELYESVVSFDVFGLKTKRKTEVKMKKKTQRNERRKKKAHRAAHTRIIKCAKKKDEKRLQRKERRNCFNFCQTSQEYTYQVLLWMYNVHIGITLLMKHICVHRLQNLQPILSPFDFCSSLAAFLFFCHTGEMRI